MDVRLFLKIVFSGMFVCDVMFDDESEWQRLVRSEQKR